jgi:flavodoxin
MKSLVIYASHKGNTKLIAERVAEALRVRGTVEMINVEAEPRELPDANLVVVGGPTEAHGMTKAVAQFFENLTVGALAGKSAAAFDTRLGLPRLFSGSAAVGIVKRLRAAGAVVLVPPESFIVSGTPELQPGELERAATWATTLGEAVDASLSTPAL